MSIQLIEQLYELSPQENYVYFQVEEAVMLMDQQTKRHRGFGFVTFDSEDVVDRICEIHFHTIKGKKVLDKFNIFEVD